MIPITKLGEFQLSRLMIGTSQFGFPSYGIANTTGQPSFDDVCAILKIAYEGGVNCLDTAPYYGESEEVLGRALRKLGLANEMVIVTKTLRLATENYSPQEAAAMAEGEILASLQRLQTDAVPVCLIHVETNFRYVEALLKLKEKGLVLHVGCSTVTPGATLEIIESGTCEAVQVPTNILDRRFSHGGVFQRGKEKGVAIFVRSSYLQGLIVMEPSTVPDDLQVVVPVLYQLRELARDAGLTIEELALRYVLGLDGLSCVVVGVESVAQMEHNVEVVERGMLPADLRAKIEALTFDLPDLIFEPWRWQRRIPDAKLIPPPTRAT